MNHAFGLVAILDSFGFQKLENVGYIDLNGSFRGGRFVVHLAKVRTKQSLPSTYLFSKQYGYKDCENLPVC